MLVFRDVKTKMPQRFSVPEGEVRIGRAADNEIRLADDCLSQHHARVIRIGRAFHFDDLESKNGILVGGARVASVLLHLGDTPIQIGAMFVTVEEDDTGDMCAPTVAKVPERSKVTLPLRALRDVTTGKGLHRVIRKSAQMQLVILRALAYARWSRPVLLLGETGTGKGLIARVIHDNGPHSPGPFLAENCATMTKELISAELFGIEEGVATGVRARGGLFAAAEGGTLFLDEIGDIDIEMQGKLLGAIEEGTYRPGGARRPRVVRARVILATNRRDKVRDDLYQRCKRIVIPPLRERPEDVAPLAARFLEDTCAELGIAKILFSESAFELLAAQRWPGNVRELKNVIEDAVLLYPHSAMLHVEHLQSVMDDSISVAAGSLRERQDVLTRDLVAGALRNHAGNQSAAARSIGMSRNGIRKAMRRFGLGG